MTGHDDKTIERLTKARAITKNQSFVPFEEEKTHLFADQLEAKQAIARFLGKPLAELLPQQMRVINQIVEETLYKDQVESKVKQYFTLSLHQILTKE